MVLSIGCKYVHVLVVDDTGIAKIEDSPRGWRSSDTPLKLLSRSYIGKWGDEKTGQERVYVISPNLPQNEIEERIRSNWCFGSLSWQ